MWLTLGEAARVLGVDDTTLRGWADAGKVRVFRTPGGHRRFNAADLDALISAAPLHAGAPDETSGDSARRWIASRPWFTRIGDEARTRARVQCARLMDALEVFLDGDGGTRPRDRKAARRIGVDLGREVASWGLTPAQSTEVFLHFKRGVFDMLTKARGAPAGQVQSLRDADAFLGDALHAMIEAFEEQRPG